MRVTLPQPAQHPPNEWCTGNPAPEQPTPPLQQQQQQQMVVSACAIDEADCTMDPADSLLDVTGDAAACDTFGGAQLAVEQRATDGSRAAQLRAGVELEGAVLVRQLRKERNKQLLTIGPKDAAPSYIGQVCTARIRIRSRRHELCGYSLQ